ncbi:nucleotidyltransferase family protein [Virgibacillus sp. FSP13]
MITDEQDVIQVIKEDPWMMEALHMVQSLKLPDWWICAGFIRSKIWDVLHEYRQRTAIQDVDVIYFDKENSNEAEEKQWENVLKKANPIYPWSVKNEARMHLVNRIPPYKSSEDAIAKFPETATSLGVKLDEEDNITLTAPHGISDVANMHVKPTPSFQEHPELMTIYYQRTNKKNWQFNWPKVTIET